ncbi:MAG: glycosyltransferase family 2 protein [Amylibacter sp.]
MLAVSIVLYKTNIETLRRCLDCLISSNYLKKVFIIDNSFEPSCSKSDLTSYQNVEFELIHRPDNPGYGRAHNIAIMSDCLVDFHLVINADVYFTNGVLDNLCNYMYENQEVGQLMPLVRYPNGDNQYLCKLVPSPLDLIKNYLSNYRFFFKIKKNFRLKNCAYDKVYFIPYLSGCFMLLRKSIVKKIGGFDERFFLYPEDVDLTRRMAIVSETVCNPHYEIYHEHGAHTTKSLKIFLIHSYNMILYFNKWGWINDKSRQVLNKKTINQFEEK